MRKMNQRVSGKDPKTDGSGGVFAQKGRFKKSNRYKKLQSRFRELCRKETAARNIQHNLLANRILSQGDAFFSPQIDYSLQARRSDTIWGAREKAYTGAGKLIGENAPAVFMRRLDRKIKARAYQGITEINLQNVTLPANLQGVQMNLYTAFLLQRYGENINSYDPSSLAQEYDVFITA